MAMKRILIIEDEEDLREALHTKLAAEGYRVETAETSELGLKSIIENKPDLILLDVLTHSIHAAAFLQRLRDLPPGKNDSKVIVLTNLDNDITRKKVMEYNVEDYLVKAKISLEEIAKKVKKLLPE
jgi:DNA-binding response OmpR family regulator